MWERMPAEALPTAQGSDPHSAQPTKSHPECRAGPVPSHPSGKWTTPPGSKDPPQFQLCWWRNQSKLMG